MIYNFLLDGRDEDIIDLNYKIIKKKRELDIFI